jgi:hypothetical protein
LTVVLEDLDEVGEDGSKVASNKKVAAAASQGKGECEENDDDYEAGVGLSSKLTNAEYSTLKGLIKDPVHRIPTSQLKAGFIDCAMVPQTVGRAIDAYVD